MTFPTVIRIFFAVDLPSTVKDDIGKFIHALKKQSRSHSIRWTKPENLHITLQFLAEMRTEDLTKLINLVRENLKEELKTIKLMLKDVHLFPSPYRPRVIVLDVAPQKELAKLSAQIGESIKSLGYEIDARPYRAHLTIGRIKQPHGINLDFISQINMPVVDEMAIDEIVLFRSEPEFHGSKYTALEKINLSRVMTLP